MKYDIYVLGCLMERPHHGYEIKRKLEESFGFCQKISNNTIYPILAKFLKHNAVSKTVETSATTPNRNIYTITDQGRLLFTQELNNFDDSTLETRENFFMKIYFFSYYTPQLRQRILTYRKEFLENTLQFLQQRDLTPQQSRQGYRQEMGEFHKEFMTNEIELIEKLEKRIFEPCLIDEFGQFIEKNPTM